MARKKNLRGFTLIELSIVLVIIGLIVGGVLVGRDLIHAAELKHMASTLEGFKTAFQTFRVKYNDMPGDMIDPSQFWSDITGNGNGNRIIDSWPTESALAWRELKAAELADVYLVGSSSQYGRRLFTDNDSQVLYWYNRDLYTPATAPYGNTLTLSTINSPWVSGPSINTEDNRALDFKLDDGVAGSGKYRGRFANDTGGVLIPGCTTGATPDQYNLDGDSSMRCRFLYYVD